MNKPSRHVKIALQTAFEKSGMTKAEFARKLDVVPQEVTRLLDTRFVTKIDTLVRALKVLGYTVTMRTIDLQVPHTHNR